jgi:flagellar FliJ protein
MERMLEIRRYREREKELELAAATARCLELQNRIRDCQAGMTGELRRRGGVRGSLDLADLQAGELYRRRLAAETRLARETLKRREQERSAAQEAYMVASRDRKVLERLRERREKEYYREARREEFKEMDDISQAARAR